MNPTEDPRQPEDEAGQPQGAGSEDAKADASNGLAIAGFICSLAGLFVNPYLLCSVVGLVLSCLGLKKKAHRGLAIAGVVLGIIGIIVYLVLIVIAAGMWGMFFSQGMPSFDVA